MFQRKTKDGIIIFDPKECFSATPPSEARMKELYEAIHGKQGSESATKEVQDNTTK